MRDSLSEKFCELRRRNRKALIPFIMAGDPSLEETPQLLSVLQDAGADILEVGIPFSDPLADGPTIQAAAQRALDNGVTARKVLQMLVEVRPRLNVPVVCLTYWNPIAHFSGRDDDGKAFLKAAADAGVAGVVVPDLPLEEAAGFRAAARKAGVCTIFLVAPTSPPKRMKAIAQAGNGFLYCVTVAGTTGARQALPASLVHQVRQLRLVSTLPVCVGFGISTPKQAAAVAKLADGVIVGSALVKAIADAPQQKKRAEARAFVSALSKAVARV